MHPNSFSFYRTSHSFINSTYYLNSILLFCFVHVCKFVCTFVILKQRVSRTFILVWCCDVIRRPQVHASFDWRKVCVFKHLWSLNRYKHLNQSSTFPSKMTYWMLHLTSMKAILIVNKAHLHLKRWVLSRSLYRKSVYRKLDFRHWQVVMGEVELLETPSQLNQLPTKMIHCLEAHESPAGQNHRSKLWKFNNNTNTTLYN